MSVSPKDPEKSLGEKSLGDSHLALASFREGDAASISRLMTAVRPFLKHQIQEMLGRGNGREDDPSDLVQCALFQAVERAESFQGKTLGEWRAWLTTIARNQVIDSYRFWKSGKRDSGRVASLNNDEVASREPSPSSMVARTENSKRLTQALAQLDESDRQLIQWQQLEGLAHAEIARRLAISEAASRQRLKTAINRLRAAWRRHASDGT